jgi:tetratricopeptide (TPR) repeat protein
MSKSLKCLMRGDFDNVLAFADRAVQCAPNFPHAHEVRGEVLEVRGEFREAIGEYTKVASARDYHGLVSRGRVYEKIGERDKAAADYCDAVLSNRTGLYVDIVASHRVRRPGYYPVEAQPDAIPSLLKFIGEAIEREPDNRDLRECRKLILSSEGDGAGAVQLTACNGCAQHAAAIPSAINSPLHGALDK